MSHYPTWEFVAVMHRMLGDEDSAWALYWWARNDCWWKRLTVWS